MVFKFVSLKKARGDKYKFEAIVFNTETGRENKIMFGAKGYEHYTDGHLDDFRKDSYIARHSKRENWSKSGANTAGWWSYNFLWRFKTYKKAMDYIKKTLK